MYTTRFNLSSLTLHPPYIGSCRNRDYISNRSLLLSNQFYFIRPSIPKSLFSRKNNDYIFNTRTELNPIKYAPSFHIFDDEKKRAKTSSSFALLTHIPTTEKSLTSNHIHSMSDVPNSSSYDQRICDQGNKYIIQLKTDEYHENEFLLTPLYDQYQLIIDAKHNEEDHLGGFVRRELHKIFPIPKYIDLKKYTYTYNRHAQELTIEMPYLSNEIKSNVIIPEINSPLTFSYIDLNLTNGEAILPRPTPSSLTKPIETEIKSFDFDLFNQSAFHPQIISSENNEEKLLMSLDLNDYQPEDIQISIQNHELIVKAERQSQTDTRKSRQTFFQSTTLPPRTDIERLQSNYLQGKLFIEAPYINNNEQNKETSSNDTNYQQRTETVIEFIRRRRI